MVNYEYIYAFISKSDGHIIVKGLSLDGIKWFKMPTEYQYIYRHHPQILKYVSKIDQMVQSRQPKIPITKLVKSTYLNDENKLFYKDKLLEEDDPSKDDSIISELNELSNSNTQTSFNGKLSYKNELILNFNF